MSYSIGLEIDTGGEHPTDLGEYWNFTSNCAPMWRRAGADLADFEGKLAAGCLPLTVSAIEHMKANPSVYEAMNPLNGWGDYPTCLTALVNLASMLRIHPKATVRVSR